MEQLSPCTQLRAHMLWSWWSATREGSSQRSLGTTATERPLRLEKNLCSQTHIRCFYKRKPHCQGSGREQEGVAGRRVDAASSPDSRLLPRPGQGHLGSEPRWQGSQHPVPPVTRPSLPRPPGSLQVGLCLSLGSDLRVLPQPPRPCEGANGPSSSVPPFAEPGTDHLSAWRFPIPQSP